MGKRPPCKLVLHLAVWVRLGEETVGTRAGEPQQMANKGQGGGWRGAMLGGNLGSLTEANQKRCEAGKAERDG